MSQFDYEKTLLGYLESIRMSIIARPLVLGGAAAFSGGVGGPPGGFVGHLPQTKVAYDLSEASSSSTPVSGYSLLDNLNHIRFRLTALELPTSNFFFFHEELSDISGYESLLTVPADDPENIESVVVNNGSGEVLLDRHATPIGQPGLTFLNAGAWLFNVYARVDNASVGTSSIVFRVYKRNLAGTETELFNVTQDLSSSSVTEYDFEHISPDIFIDINDRIVIKTFAKTTSGSNRTVYFYYEGTAHYSHVHTPFEMTTGGSASTLSVEQNGVLIGSGITVLNFVNSTVVNTSPGHVTVTSLGGGGGESVSHIYNETLSGTTHFSTANQFNASTLRVFYNGVKQDDNYFTPDGDRHGFTTTFTVLAGDELFVDYDIPGSGVASSGVGHTIQDEGVSLAQRTKLNFVGTGVTVVDDISNDATKVTISGGGGSSIVWDDFVTTASGVTGTNDSVSYSYLSAKIIVMQPLKITQIDWYIQLSGTYDLRLMTGPKYAGNGFSLRNFALNEPVTTSSGYHIFSVSPPYIMYPGTYNIELKPSNGSNTIWNFNTNNAYREYGNELFTNSQTWFGSLATSYSPNTCPINIHAYKGVITG